MRMTAMQNSTLLPNMTDHPSSYWSYAESTPDSEVFTTAVLPEQFFQPPTNEHAGAPELRLMRAVMEDAIRCFQKQFVPGSRRNYRIAQEATRWFFDDDTTWPYSFLNLCHALGVDPGYIRRRLRQWRETRPVMVMQGKLGVATAQRKTKLAA